MEWLALFHLLAAPTTTTFLPGFITQTWYCVGEKSLGNESMGHLASVIMDIQAEKPESTGYIPVSTDTQRRPRGDSGDKLERRSTDILESEKLRCCQPPGSLPLVCLCSQFPASASKACQIYHRSPESFNYLPELKSTYPAWDDFAIPGKWAFWCLIP